MTLLAKNTIMTVAQKITYVFIALVIVTILAVIKCEQTRPTKEEAKVPRPPRAKRLKHPPTLVGKSSSGVRDVSWDDSELGLTLRVRPTLEMTSTTIFQEGPKKITAYITIMVTKGAEYWDDKTSDWQEMRESQYRRWLPNTVHPIQFSATASLTKKIDGLTDKPLVTGYSAFGKDRNDPEYDTSKVDNGIGIYLDWQKDNLIIEWIGSPRYWDRNERPKKILKIMFPERFKELSSDRTPIPKK